MEEALGQFVDLIADPELDRSPAERVYRGLGRGEYRERRSLDALLAAYRLGARVAWRRVADLAIEARVDRRTLALLAEAVFAYIDGISALSVEGYAEEQTVQAGEAQRRRRRLARLLLDAEHDAEAVAHAAIEAGWEPPATVAVLRWPPGARRLRARLPIDALVLQEEGGEGGTAIVGDPAAPGLARTLERGAEGSVAVLGPSVPPAAASVSAARAGALLQLVTAGAVAGVGLLRTEDHLPELITYGEPGALEELARRRLAPLGDETAASRERLTETLRAWLDHQGEVSAVAAELHVHPQTVRYRLGRLRERLGTALDDPQARFELALALRGLRVQASGKVNRT